MIKKITALAFCLSFLICCSINLYSHQALLSKHYYAAGNPGAWFDRYTEFYDYVEEDNELFLSSISKHGVSGDNVNGETSYIYNYHATHSTIVNDLGKTYYYSIYNDSTNALYYNKAYTIDAQNRLVYFGQGTTFMQKYYNPVTGFLDSLMFRNWSGYTKYVNNPDSLSRVQTYHQYSSTDSVNWQLVNIRTFQYSNLLPLTLNLQTPELNNSNLCTVLNENYAIQTMSDDSIYPQNWIFTYTLNPSNLRIMYSDQFFESTYTDVFDLSGRIISTSYSSASPSRGSSTSYIWGEYTVSNEDDYITPEKLSVYPNPFRNNLNIKTASNTQINSVISIYNIKGQLVRSWKDVKSDELTWDGKDTSNQSVSSGVYIIKARQGINTLSTKIIKLN